MLIGFIEGTGNIQLDFRRVPIPAKHTANSGITRREPYTTEPTLQGSGIGGISPVKQ